MNVIAENTGIMTCRNIMKIIEENTGAQALNIGD